jgi:hypothetical protein
VILALSALGVPRSPWPSLCAVAAFAAAVALSLSRPRRLALPAWIAAVDLAVSIGVPLAVAAQLDPAADNGYATWYIAAVGTLLTILAVRGRAVFAWIGTGVLTLHTLCWAGAGALVPLGVVGSILWVAAANVVMYALRKTAEDAERFAAVERTASEWRAAYDAHVVERQRRMEHSYAMAEPLLTEIVRTGGQLSEEQRRGCLLLEATMRDEIRGRGLLSDEVRRAVAAARGRGATVSLLDEGGLDGLDAGARAAVLGRLAAELDGARAATIIVRTAPREDRPAVTVVGLAQPPECGAEDDSEVVLWREITP